MAIAHGLTMAIANPSQELLMNAAFASDLLLAREESDIRYIERMNMLAEKYAGQERVLVPVKKRRRMIRQNLDHRKEEVLFLKLF